MATMASMRELVDVMTLKHFFVGFGLLSVLEIVLIIAAVVWYPQ